MVKIHEAGGELKPHALHAGGTVADIHAYIYIHTYTPTHIHACTHTYIHTYIHKYMWDLLMWRIAPKTDLM